MKGQHLVWGRKNSGMSSFTSAGLLITLSQESGMLQNMRSGASKRPFCSLRVSQPCAYSGALQGQVLDAP